ncbi:hypothetical protein ARALYDRAFT_317219 [Arabidopsis lyrata subsp. lyrata]|uniref:Leucine-rich repeat-containing N-terminal plant-type domain-containing protein n=1 Tax=Arabidopsis lyrata subsp. lyrata TaxID=81972 RepID=D7L0G5_ARALL|nr:hypothetical protein ARALYDRAFT_317219 [Arabidopsis lyrata subsp. lyrata]
MLKPCHHSYFLLFFVFFIPQISFSCPQDQIQSLLEFKNLLTLNINNQSTAIITLKGLEIWRPNSDCCKWQLVRCNTCSPTREVIDLNLHSLILSGSVSSSILRPVLQIPGDGFVNLTSFISLDMSDNSFNGSIPPELFSLKNLQCLDLSRNDIGGTLSGNIKALKNLQELIFLSELLTLTLRQNLFSGSIPLSVSQLTKLETFDLQNSSLSFEIPDGIGKLANISTLSLSRNKLSGGIPSSIQNLTNLETLELENNNGLSGEIPTWLFGLQKLKILRLGGNKLQWNKNVSVYAQSKLTHLSLRSCGLEGNIPDWLKNQTALLPGSEHEQTRRKFSQMTTNSQIHYLLVCFQSISLSVLALSRNNFSGQIPDTVGETWDQYQSLSQRSTGCCCWTIIACVTRYIFQWFSGDVPAFFGSNTIMLSMSQNNFSGEFPHDFTNLPSLMHFDLHDNKISGNRYLPEKQFPGSLKVLDLSENNLDGSLPSSLGNLTSMKESLSSSSSPLPFMYSFTIEILAVNWKNSKQSLANRNLYLSKNKLFGEIPSSLGSRKSLKLLNLSYNDLSRLIPQSFGNLEKVEILDLSHNNLSGEILQTLSKLRELNVLELSNNKLTGRIPESPQLDRLNDPDIYANNNKLCECKSKNHALHRPSSQGKRKLKGKQCFHGMESCSHWL